MMSVFSEMLQYDFLRRALLVGFLVSLCAALLGVSLVLKRYSMIGDGLSHVGFGTLAVATALGVAPLKLTIPVVVAAAFLLLQLSENAKIKGDSAIALISSGALAIGVMAISITTGMNMEVYNYMFGSILSVSKEDARLSIVLCIAVLVLFIIFYNRIFAITFDETFAKATGTKVQSYNMIIAFLTAITIVIIFPALTSMQIFKKFKSVVISSAVLSVGCFFTGMIFSYVYGTPSGASVVCANLIVFLVFTLIGKIRQ